MELLNIIPLWCMLDIFTKHLEDLLNKGTWIWLLVCRPRQARKKQKQNYFFRAWAVCFSGSVFLVGGREARFPGRSLDGKPARGKKSCLRALWSRAIRGICPLWHLFFLVAFVFVAGPKQARSVDRGHLFLSCLAGLFFWACFFRKQASTISWLGPGR